MPSTILNFQSTCNFKLITVNELKEVSVALIQETLVSETSFRQESVRNDFICEMGDFCNLVLIWFFFSVQIRAWWPMSTTRKEHIPWEGSPKWRRWGTVMALGISQKSEHNLGELKDRNRKVRQSLRQDHQKQIATRQRARQTRKGLDYQMREVL